MAVSKEADGKLYQDYLEKYKVVESVEKTVDFNNYHAFRLK